jgi:hypothetical protein
VWRVCTSCSGAFGRCHVRDVRTHDVQARACVPTRSAAEDDPELRRCPWGLMAWERGNDSGCPFRPSPSRLWVPCSGLRHHDSGCPFRPSPSRLWVPVPAFAFATLAARFDLRLTTLGARFGLRLRDSGCPIRPSPSRLIRTPMIASLTVVETTVKVHFRASKSYGSSFGLHPLASFSAQLNQSQKWSTYFCRVCEAFA